MNYVVEVGQTWIHESYPEDTYFIAELEVFHKPDEGGAYYIVLANHFIGGSDMGRCMLGYTYKNRKPWHWTPGWKLVSEAKKFSHVSQKALRKRMRERLAGSLLTEQSCPTKE